MDPNPVLHWTDHAGERQAWPLAEMQEEFKAFRAWRAQQGAAVAPQEPDMRHPKIQALIGGKARREIELRLVEQLLDDPDCDLSAMDMEYWHGLHDKLRDALMARATPPAVQAAKPLTEVDMLDCVRSVGVQAPMGLTRDRGPYEVTEPTWFLVQLVRAIERKIRAAAQVDTPPAVQAPATCPTHETSSGDYVVCRRCGEVWPVGAERACVRAETLLIRAAAQGGE